MENIDLYDIHDTAFERRPECNDCFYFVNTEEVCSQMEENIHENCPFVEAVLSDIYDIEKGHKLDLLRLFIEETMELNINDEERGEIDVHYFRAFMVENKPIFADKLTDFFTRRLRDENNYRGVNVKVS